MDMYLFEPPYRTINGEAEHIGKPCVFIRFQGCHVGCNWCDAMGTWPDKKTKEAYSNETLTKYLNDKFPTTERMWITGGEPMEHYDEIYSFITHNAKYNNIPRTWHLITSGSVYNESTLMLFDHITIDIKPPSAKAKNAAPNNSFIELCMEHMELQKKVEFKMVVSNTAADIEFAMTQIARLAKYGKDITIQPLYWSEAECREEEIKAQYIKNSKMYQEGFQKPKNWLTYAEFAEFFMDNPYKNLRVLPQLHKIYWPGEMNGI